MEDRITYGITSDLNRMPTMYSKSYSEALEDAKMPFHRGDKRYLIERTEHYEVCCEIEG